MKPDAWFWFSLSTDHWSLLVVAHQSLESNGGEEKQWPAASG